MDARFVRPSGVNSEVCDRCASHYLTVAEYLFHIRKDKFAGATMGTPVLFVGRRFEICQYQALAAAIQAEALLREAKS